MNMFWMFHISLIVLRWDNPCAPVTFNKLLNYYEMNISGHSSLEFLMEMRWWQFFKVGCQTIPWGGCQTIPWGGGRQFFEGVADNSSRGWQTIFRGRVAENMFNELISILWGGMTINVFNELISIFCLQVCCCEWSLWAGRRRQRNSSE